MKRLIIRVCEACWPYFGLLLGAIMALLVLLSLFGGTLANSW